MKTLNNMTVVHNPMFSATFIYNFQTVMYQFLSIDCINIPGI